MRDKQNEGAGNGRRLAWLPSLKKTLFFSETKNTEMAKKNKIERKKEI